MALIVFGSLVTPRYLIGRVVPNFIAPDLGKFVALGERVVAWVGGDAVVDFVERHGQVLYGPVPYFLNWGSCQNAHIDPVVHARR